MDHQQIYQALKDCGLPENVRVQVSLLGEEQRYDVDLLYPAGTPTTLDEVDTLGRCVAGRVDAAYKGAGLVTVVWDSDREMEGRYRGAFQLSPKS